MDRFGAAGKHCALTMPRRCCPCASGSSATASSPRCSSRTRYRVSATRWSTNPLPPQADSAGTRRYTGEYQIAQSALEQLEITLELPFAFAAAPGDSIALELERLNLSDTCAVTEARSKMDREGERTELTISVR